MTYDNEKFITKVTIELSTKLSLNKDDSQKVMDVLYSCTKNYNVSQVEYEEGSFMDMVNLYLQAKKMEGFSSGTLKNRFYLLRELDNFIKKGYRDVNISDLRMYIAHKQQNSKATTTNAMICQIRPFFEWLLEEEYIDKNPANKLKKSKEPIRLVKSLSTVDFEKLRLACKNDRDRALVEFAFATGVRVSELISINIKDLDFSTNSLRVIGKGNKERKILFTEKAKFYLEKYLLSRKDDNEALFVSLRRPYCRLSRFAIEEIISKLKKETGINAKITPHVLRHTMATKMIEGGADITTVQHLLGHEKLETTQVYAETSKDKVNFQYKQCLTL